MAAGMQAFAAYLLIEEEAATSDASDKSPIVRRDSDSKSLPKASDKEDCVIIMWQPIDFNINSGNHPLRQACSTATSVLCNFHCRE